MRYHHQKEILRNFDMETNLIIRTNALPNKSADKYLHRKKGSLEPRKYFFS